MNTGRDPLPVSVIVPFFNAERYARQALDSVLSQTRPPRELIVVDDGSAPPGRAFLNEFFDRRESGRVVEVGDASSTTLLLVEAARRGGPGPARNLGLRASNQPLIAFQDADDVWASEKLERQVDLMEAWPELDGCHTDAVLFNEIGEEYRRPRVTLALDADLALRAPPMATPSMMVRREVLERLDGFDERLFCSQDWDLQVRLALGGHQFQRIPEALVRVRRENHGHHSGHWLRYLIGHLKVVWKHRAAYLQRGGVPALLVQGAIELRTAGLKKGGLLGAALRIPASRLWGIP